MFEDAEKIIDTLRAKQNLYYIQFVPHREKPFVQRWEILFGLGSIGKYWLQPTLRNAYGTQSHR